MPTKKSTTKKTVAKNTKRVITKSVKKSAPRIAKAKKTTAKR